MKHKICFLFLLIVAIVGMSTLNACRGGGKAAKAIQKAVQKAPKKAPPINSKKIVPITGKSADDIARGINKIKTDDEEANYDEETNYTDIEEPSWNY